MKNQKSAHVHFFSKPKETCGSLVRKLDKVVIKVSLVKGLRLRGNLQRLYRAKDLLSQNGTYIWS